jgi:hypothetical protein
MQRQNVQEGMDPMMNIEMAYGGTLPKAQVGPPKKSNTIDGIEATRVNKLPEEEGWSLGRTTEGQSGAYRRGQVSEKTYDNTEKAVGSKSGPDNNWKNSLCDRLMNGASIDELVSAGHGTKEGLSSILADCVGKADEKFKPTAEAVYIDPVTEEVVTKETPGAIELESPILPPAPRDPAKPWLQDRISRGNAFIDYMNVDKALPWAPSVNPEQIDPTFYDPTRELAQQSEEANMITQGLSQFSGPQATSVAASQIQGNAAKNAANTLGKYNNMNVGVANQNEAQNAQIDINAQLANAATAKELYDKNTVANQQYANSKSGLRNNLVQAENNLLSNMWKTDTMNQMYPQYNVNPGNGGEMTYDETKGKQLTGQVTETYDEAIIRHRRKGMTLEEAEDAEEREWKRKNRSSQSGSAESQVLSQYAKEGGSIDSIFEMGTSAFPFYGFY